MFKASIIVPVYNKSKYINQCLESLVNQTFNNIEIVLINDGSTDDSAKKCSSWARKDKRIIFIDNKNQGVSATRNQGISIASGDSISFVDADDYIALDAIEVCKKEIEMGIDVCYFGRYPVSNGKVLSHYLTIPERYEVSGDDIRAKFVANFLGSLPNEENRRYVSGSACTAVYSADFIKSNQLQFENIKLNEDALFNINAMRYANRVSVIPNIFYYNVINSASAARSYKADRFEQFKDCYSRIMECWPGYEICEDFSERADYRFWTNVNLSARSEMLHFRENGFLHVYKKIGRICRDSEVHRIAVNNIHREKAVKKKVFAFLIAHKLKIGIMAYFIIWKLKEKINPDLRFKQTE